MIAHIRGTVAEKFVTHVVVDVAGVGYEVALAQGDFEKTMVESDVKFFTYHHIREQSQELFGFSSLLAKKLFELLITVQGVGPKAALAVLSLGEAETVRNGLAHADTAFIQKATGIGKKTAERIAVDLADKVGIPTYSSPGEVAVNTDDSVVVPDDDDALEALMALGYTLNDAVVALAPVSKDLSTAERVRAALSR
ncbi:Holliday junction branch migration protein RuvA [Candidatus Saccharibacteria bacterium]|nr:Holliday junction branch migration protein RuvA [Candidatus Saccharibacteria bacterium]